MATKPDPATLERRTSDRHKSVLAVGKIVIDGRERFCLIRDVSSGGLMIETSDPLVPDQRVEIESLGLPPSGARVAWRKDGLAGLAFDEPKDAEALCRRGVDEAGRTIRGPRFRIERLATLRLADQDAAVELVDISVGGARLRGATSPRIDMPGQLILGAPLAPIYGYVRWTKGDDIGFRFMPALERRALITLIG